MKVFSVIGYTKSGKTTTIEHIIKELVKRGYTVGSVKDIHYEQFKIDTEGTNTHRHRVAGSSLVVARGMYETDVLYQERLPIDNILKLYNHDYVILEGVTDTHAPKIVTASNTDDIDKRMDETTFLISGCIADTMDEYKGIDAISAVQDIEVLVDRIEKEVGEYSAN